MAKNLIIVESPAKAKTITRFAGKGFMVKASMGHIRDLPKTKLGVDVENDFKPQYTIDVKKRKIIKELKEAASKADYIYLASDHDREGEAIAWHLAEVLKKELKNKTVHRIVFNEITQKAITKAIKSPGTIDFPKVESQQARRILDRIVGYNISPLLWKVISKNLSAGRVQSVALRLICEREDEIKKFDPKEYWTIEAILKRDELLPFKASLHKWEGKKAEIPNKEKADEILKHIKNEEFIISDIKKSVRKIHPTPPYITSTLQQDAARILGYSAKKTMMIAQQLYEGVALEKSSVGLITYMRTDSLRLSSESLAAGKKLIIERFGEKYLHDKTRVYKNKSSAQDAHEAIRPTYPSKTPASIKHFLSPDQFKLYSLIWQKFIATQMIPISLHTVQIDTKAGKANFLVKGNTIINKGFMEVFPHVIMVLGEEIDKNYQKGDILDHEKCSTKQNFTKPPARYREATLIKELESKGIGRPSTYASITNTIQVRKYVILKEKRFFPTDLGYTVYRFLIAYFDDFFNVTFTAKMEENLDLVEFGDIKWIEILKSYYGDMTKLIESVDVKSAKKDLAEKTDIPCEKCGANLIVKWGKNGAFLSCPNYPECKTIHNFEKDEDGKIHIKKPETLAENCPQCGNPLMVRNGRFGKFIACTNYPKCKYTKPFTIGVKCPECKKGDITEKKSKKGRAFFSCTNYPDCKFITNNKPVPIKCPACDNPYIEERFSKQKGNYKKCPVCGHEVF
ncbi:MAG: type I DNA topoisomerase [Candidatus Cloacimonetes bacterium]|nr:type I DNA topoisomerase [Candidatus Cloacimonadota bacterium]